jgi:hypothetical protein
MGEYHFLTESAATGVFAAGVSKRFLLWRRASALILIHKSCKSVQP